MLFKGRRVLLRFMSKDGTFAASSGPAPSETNTDGSHRVVLVVGAVSGLSSFVESQDCMVTVGLRACMRAEWVWISS